MEENLNIHYHVKRLILIAVGKYKTENEQASKLGISPKTLYRYRKIYDLPIRQKRNERNKTKSNAATR